MAATGLLKQGGSLTPDAAAPQAAPAGAALPQVQGFGPFCKIACDVAQAAATAACTATIEAPPVLVLCIAAAQAAGDACRNAC
jgi:hypothetical protein